MKDRIFEPDLNWADQLDLALAPTIESARKLVSLCFRDNASYYFGKLNPRVSPDPGSAFERYCTLIKRAPTERADDRRSAIEVQVNGTVHLSGQLLFVALPREFFADAAIKDAVENHWKCDAICYPTFIGGAPAEYYSVVRDRITLWLEQKGHL
ncbi:MAG: hypothetical protein KGL39_57565 [Patescibacteria group bacterium]|nr:hypothetical protein [Patescibacteria group bacterium]